MLKDFMQYLVNKVQPLVVNHDGRKFVVRPDGSFAMIPGEDPSPEVLELSSLTSLVDYVKSGADGYAKLPHDLTVQVVSPTQVRVFDAIQGEFKQRDHLAVASPMLVEHYFGDHLPQEHMIVWLNTGFMPTDNVKTLLQIVSSLRDEVMSESTDDGISQTVAAKAGTARLANVTIPNPIKLVPLRTFFEVEQVESDHLLRIKGKNALCIREADGGAWKLVAMQRIKDYLVEKLPEGINVLA